MGFASPLPVILLLTVVIALGAVQFFFNPLGLGPEPPSVLPESFFAEPAASLPELNLLIDGEEAFSEALSAIGAARESVWIQTFIWRDDEAGRGMAGGLKAAAQRGVKVTVNKDFVGTFFELPDIMNGRLSPVFADARLRNMDNVDVRVRPFADTDHSKYFIIDKNKVIFGGMNIGDEYRLQWHDYMVMMQSEKWAGAFFDKTVNSAPWPQNAPFFVASNDRRATEIRTALLQTIAAARQSVVLEHAYFSDAKVIAALKEAAGRGVRVTVILPERPGTHHYANMATVNRLLAARGDGADIEVFLYPRMTHAKVGLIDGTVAAVGSANLTPRSMLTSREVTVFAHGRADEPFIKRLADRLDADVAESRRVEKPFDMGLYEKTGAFLGKYTW